MKRKQLAWRIMVVVLTLMAGTGIAEPTDRFVQDRFAIGFFGDPPPGSDYDVRFAEIAEANFTVAILGGLAENDPSVLRKKLALCEENGLKAIAIQLGVAAEDLVEAPACWGYALRDEPGTKDFPDLQPMVAALRSARPGKLGLINLFPSYASPWGQLGAANYTEYVSRFLAEVDVDVLCMDHYPRFLPHGGDGRDAYCADLAVMRTHAMEKGIPFWNFFNSMPYGPHTDPTEAQLRWQAFASVAYGARGVFYFCYWTPTFRGPDGGFEFSKGGAIITADGRRTRHYDEARRLNGRLKALGPVLMQLTSTATYRVTPDDDPATVLSGSPLRNLIRADVEPPHDYLVGAFRHTDGRRAVLLQNYRFAYSAWPTVVFDVPSEAIVEISQQSGKEIPLIDDSPEMDGIQISLDAGEGRLFLLPHDETP